MDPTYQGEGLLLRWGETSTAGRTVTFIIEEDAPIHAFKGFPVGKDGQRFMIVAVPIGNDQQPGGVSEKPRKSWSELTRAAQAGIRASDLRFRRFLADTKIIYGDNGAPVSEALAAEAIRARCGVASRSEIDESPDAMRKWDDLERYYRQWGGFDPEVRG